MEHSFETPHPSIHSQDQIFKLPSSQPCYSPNLSPVPHGTRSRNLKENRVSTSWTEHTSKTLIFGGRSASVSSSNSSFSSKSKDPQTRTKKFPKANMKSRSSRSRNSKSGSTLGINLARALASPFISRASSPINDQGSNINPDDLHPKPRLNPGKRGLSDTFYNPNLPSPLSSQTHNADGPHGREKGAKYHAQSAHISPSSKVILDLNTQLKQKRRKGGHRVTVSADGTREGGGAIANYPGEGTVGKNDKKNKGQQRERRPSAPSSYSLRLRHPALPLLSAAVGLQGNGNKRSRLARLEIIRNVNNDGIGYTGANVSATGIPTAASTMNAIDDDGFVIPLFLDSHNKNTATANFAAAPDVDMDWRVGIVDFNRPPSQMCHYSMTTMPGGWAGGDVFSSSGSEGSSSSESENHEDNSDKEIKGTQPMVNPTRAIRTRTRSARPLASGSMSGSGFGDPFGFGFGSGSVLPFDSNSNLRENLDLDLNTDMDQSMFGEGALGISTPLRVKIQRQAQTEENERKERRTVAKACSGSNLRSNNGGLVKMRSLPVMSSVGGKAMELDDRDVDANEEDEQCTYEQEQDEQDMDLTTPLITATTHAAVASTTLQLVDGRGDRTPWIMDSLISPPSQFLKTQGEIGKGGNDGDEGYVNAGNLSSTSSSSPSSEHDILSSPFRLTSDTQPAVTHPTITAATTSSFTAKRTRSGTIVPSSHRIGNTSSNSTNTSDPPGMRRTRSGTLVGPLSLPLPLAASGSDVQLVVGNGNLPVRKAREKSGSVLAGLSPLPLLGVGVGVGTRRTRSGTVVGRAPIPVSTLPVSVSVSVSAPGGRSVLGLGPEDTSTNSNLKSSESRNMDRADEHLADNILDEITNADVDFGADVDVEPHIDALYMPRLSPSPDPIDFLRLAHLQDYDGMREKHRFGSGLTIEEREDENPDFRGSTGERMEDELAWCIADEPPSPILLRNESKLMTGRSQVLSEGGGNRNSGASGGNIRGRRNGNDRGRQGNGTRNMKEMWRTRFMIDGHEKQPDEIVVECEEGEDSDDELLLKDRSALGI